MMKILKRITSLQRTLLLHELSFVVLLILTASVAIAWSYSWQKSSEEVLRLASMNTSIQNVRGELYRQLKEVFDASFLHDLDAVDEYQQYTRSIQLHFNKLSNQAMAQDELTAINRVKASYEEFYNKTVVLFEQTSFDQVQKQRLDNELEHETFAQLETAFKQMEVLLTSKQTHLATSRHAWSKRLALLIPVPFLIAITLVFVARRFVKRNVVSPLAHVMDGAKLISQGDLEHKISPSGVAELIRLSDAINDMAVELETNRENLVETKRQAALADLIPLVAHNIRNPLAGIRAASQVARDESKSQDTKETLTDIMVAVDRLELWVSSLLSYLHPVKPNLANTTLTTIVDNVLVLMELQLIDSPIKITKSGWVTEPSQVLLDSHLCEQALFNLIQNSIEASSSEDKIDLIYNELDKEITLEIRDYGPGMTFDPISEQVMSGPIKQQSCGLGIPFAIKIIKQHGGTLEYLAGDTVGTRAIIRFQRQAD